MVIKLLNTQWAPELVGLTVELLEGKINMLITLYSIYSAKTGIYICSQIIELMELLCGCTTVTDKKEFGKTTVETLFGMPTFF